MPTNGLFCNDSTQRGGGDRGRCEGVCVGEGVGGGGGWGGRGGKCKGGCIGGGESGSEGRGYVCYDSHGARSACPVFGLTVLYCI